MILSEDGLSNRIYWKVKTLIYENIPTVSTNIEMKVDNHTLEEVRGCLKEIEGVVARLEEKAKLILECHQTQRAIREAS